MLLFLSTKNESSALSWMLKCSVEIKFYHLFRVLLRVNLLVFYSYLSCTFNLLTCFFFFFFFPQWWNNRTNITREKETWKTTKEEKAGRFTKVNKNKKNFAVSTNRAETQTFRFGHVLCRWARLFPVWKRYSPRFWWSGSSCPLLSVSCWLDLYPTAGPKM